ncbi:FHA domain-containing protein [Runella sp.]|uniref:FHA domain-containing protein n=1 Tax=Runella sp. TaxID=1960881 RepID=UPI003D120F4F
MQKFKNESVACEKCLKPDFVKASQFESGSFKCKFCGHVNQLTIATYDENIMGSLIHYGALINSNAPAEKYLLRPGTNVIGVGQMADIQIKRAVHNGKCFVSRRHCTLTVSFDKRNGQLLYLLRDGAAEQDTGQYKNSLNFTFYKGKKIEPEEEIYLQDQDTINLGGEDSFRVEQYVIPEQLLENYKIIAKKEDGETTE